VEGIRAIRKARVIIMIILVFLILIAGSVSLGRYLRLTETAILVATRQEI
jgi:hypothetical protein